MNTPTRPDWYDRLARGPAESVAADPSQVRRIVRDSRNSPAQRRHRVALTLSGTALLLLLLIGGSSYAWIRVQQHDIAQAAIPGTSERAAVLHAIEQFRSYSVGQMEIQYVEPWNDGVLVFYQRFFKEGQYDMQVEYVRMTWRGWKWANGGGMSGGKERVVKDVFYSYLPTINDFRLNTRPSPLVYGVLVDEEKRVIIEDGQGFTVEATVFPSDDQLGWFALLPDRPGAQYRLTAYDANGQAIATGTLDTNDYASNQGYDQASSFPSS